MSRAPNFTINFRLLVIALEILDSFKLSKKDIDSPISRDHESLRSKFHNSLISQEKPKAVYSIFISRREAAYLRKVVFQYFIVLLRAGLHDEKAQYHELYMLLSDHLGKKTDEIKDIIERLKK